MLTENRLWGQNRSICVRMSGVNIGDPITRRPMMRAYDKVSFVEFVGQIMHDRAERAPRYTTTPAHLSHVVEADWREDPRDLWTGL